MDEQPCDHQSSIARELGQIDQHGTVEFNARHSEGRHTALAEKQIMEAIESWWAPQSSKLLRGGLSQLWWVRFPSASA
jgi:hypothetical protein